MDILTILSLGQTALELGLICSLTVLALFLSYTMLNVCDLSTDGCFTLGAAVGAAVAIAGHPWLSLGAAMAAEIGTMRVTEQIDALSTLSTNPYKYLVAPRLLAGVIVLPLLVLVGDVIGIFGGYIVAVYQLDFNPANYINATVNELQPIDVYTGVIKAAVFGFVIALMGCYNGYKSKGGAQGVGEATTNAVVASSIIILIFNYIITGLIFTK